MVYNSCLLVSLEAKVRAMQYRLQQCMYPGGNIPQQRSQMT